MSDDPRDRQRMLMEVDRLRRLVNRAEINPRVRELRIEDIDPIVSCMARARAAYIEHLFEVANGIGDQDPKLEDVTRLRELGSIYEELLKATKALELAIERGYLDVTEYHPKGRPQSAE
ncbi:hypothetical protein [Endothiovibrio diazotrophicus]